MICWSFLLLLIFIPLTLANILTILHDSSSTRPAKELRRYLYLATNELPALQSAEESGGLGKIAEKGFVIVLGEASSILVRSSVRDIARSASNSLPHAAGMLDLVNHLSEEADNDTHALQTVQWADTNMALLCIGSSPRSTSYSVFSLIEHVTAIRFHLHGDVLPDRTLPLPSLRSIVKRIRNDGISLTLSPTSSVRGVQPFHDFSEGPDWWNAEEYKHHFDQMHKLKMNFMGLHTYPLSEPTVWTGRANDVNPDGTVKEAYFSSYQNTGKGGDWGGVPGNTSGYVFGAHQIFSHECYGAETQMEPDPEVRENKTISESLCPTPITWPSAKVFFDRVGSMFKDVFTYARQLGHLTCVCIESGNLGIKKPDPNVSSVDYFRGIFTRINRTYPIDYFWIWTEENWAVRNDADIPISDPSVQLPVSDMLAAHQARKDLGLDKTLKLATCGWTVGPRVQREYFDKVLPADWTITSINEGLGNVNCEPEYAKITNHAKWSIPWMEDDPGLLGLQFWANRTLAYAAQAAAYDVEGLLGIHWRTKVIAPQFLALAQFPWNNSVTTLDLYIDLCVTSFGLSADDAAGLAAVWNSIDSYYPNAPPSPSPPYPPPIPPSGKKCKVQRIVGCFKDNPRVWSEMVTANSRTNDQEWCAGWCAKKNYSYAGVEYGVACFCGNREPPTSAKIDDGLIPSSQCKRMKCAANPQEDCGGSFILLAYTFSCTDILRVVDSTRGNYSGVNVDRFHTATKRAAAYDSTLSTIPLPRPDATGCPGRLVPKAYDPSLFAFVDAFGAYRPKVKGAANLARFDYWLTALEYLRSMAKTASAWEALNNQTLKCSAPEVRSNPQQLLRQYTSKVVPARIALVESARETSNYLMQIVGSTGAMGNVTNLQQQSFPHVLRDTHKAMLELFQRYYDCGPDSSPVDGRADRVCIADCPRLLPYEVTEASQLNSHEWCAAQCFNQGYRVSGVEFGVACFCGNETNMFPSSAVRPMVECQAIKCAANSTESCGGSCLMLAYNISCKERPNVPAPPPLPAAAMPDGRYTGKERVFVMTPRTVAEDGKLTLKIMALLHESTKVDTVNIYVKRMGAAVWNPAVVAKPPAAADTSGRNVYRAQLVLSFDSEYYVELATSADPHALQWPAGGPMNAQTVVVLS